MSRSQYWHVAGLLILVLLATLLLWYSNANNMQAVGATAAKIRFEGEYRIDDGPWEKITDGQHIPSTKGDVTLKGNFHLFSPGGEYIGIYSGNTPIAFYTDHLNLTRCLVFLPAALTGLLMHFQAAKQNQLK